VKAHHADSRRQRLVVHRHHAAFAGGDGLGRIEAEGGRVASGPDQPASIGGGQGVGGVLDDLESALARQRPDAVHVARLPRDVDGDDGLRPRGDEGLDGGGVDVEGVGPAIHQDGPRLEVGDHLTGGGKRVSRDDDLVARAETDRLQSQMEGRRRRV
jgi:hypothetical protein